MKRTFTYFALKGITPKRTLIKCMVEDVFELLSEIPQVATKSDVQKAIMNKYKQVTK